MDRHPVYSRGFIYSSRPNASEYLELVRNWTNCSMT